MIIDGPANIFILISDENDVPKCRFTFCESVTIVLNRKNITQTATVTIPQRGKNISNNIKVGYKIKIHYGYGITSPTSENMEYSGIISNISPMRNVVLSCEDEYPFKLKKQSVGESKTYKKRTLKTLIEEFYKQPIEVPNSDSIGDWSIDKNATFIDVLNDLKNKFGIFAYWQKGVLKVGSELSDRTRKTILCDVDGIKSNVVLGSANIELKKGDDFKPISYGICPKKDGTKLEVYAYFKGEKNSEIIVTTTKPSQGVLNKFEINSNEITEAELKKQTVNRLPNLYSTGISGSIKTFGAPSMEINDAAKIIYNENPDVNGIYEITGITKTFSVSDGIKQVFELGQKL